MAALLIPSGQGSAKWIIKGQTMMHLWRRKETLYRPAVWSAWYVCEHTCTDTQCFTPPAFDTNTFKALPTPPFTHSLFPKTASPFLPFLPMHIVQKLYFWLTRLEHKGSSYTSRRSPTREASIPSRIGECVQKELALLFPSLTFPYKIKPLGFWMVCAIFFTHATPPPSPPSLHSRDST